MKSILAAVALALSVFVCQGAPGGSGPVTYYKTTNDLVANATGDLFLRNNVKLFGAKGDGFSDDSSAVQAAINHVAAMTPANTGVGRTIYFPSGTYRIGTPLVIPQSAGLRLEGDGGGYSTSTLQWTGANGSVNAGWLIDARSVLGFGIKSLRIIGQSDIYNINSAQIANGVWIGRNGAGGWFSSYNSWHDVEIKRFSGTGLKIGRYAGWDGVNYPADTGQVDNSAFYDLSVRDCRVPIEINTLNFLCSSFYHLYVDNYGGNPVDGGGVPIEDGNATPIPFRVKNAIRLLYGDLIAYDSELIATYDDGTPESQYAIYCLDGSPVLFGGYSEARYLLYRANGANGIGGTGINKPCTISGFKLYPGAAGGPSNAAKYPVYWDNEFYTLNLNGTDGIYVMESSRLAAIATGCKTEMPDIAFKSFAPFYSHSHKSSELGTASMLYRNGYRFETSTRIGESAYLSSDDVNEFFVTPFRRVRDPSEESLWQDQRSSTNIDAHVFMADTNGLTLGWVPGPSGYGAIYSKADLIRYPVWTMTTDGRMAMRGTNTTYSSYYRGTGFATNRLGAAGFSNPGDASYYLEIDNGDFQVHVPSSHYHEFFSGSTLVGLLSLQDSYGMLSSVDRIDSGRLGLGIANPVGGIREHIYETNALNYQLHLSNDGTYHTGILATTNYTSDPHGWALVGGPNSYQSGAANAVGLVIAPGVPYFSVNSVSPNISSGGPSPLMRLYNGTGNMEVAGMVSAPSFLGILDGSPVIAQSATIGGSVMFSLRDAGGLSTKGYYGTESGVPNRIVLNNNNGGGTEVRDAGGLLVGDSITPDIAKIYYRDASGHNAPAILFTEPGETSTTLFEQSYGAASLSSSTFLAVGAGSSRVSFVASGALVYPNTSNTVTLGTSSNPWKEINAKNFNSETNHAGTISVTNINAATPAVWEDNGDGTYRLTNSPPGTTFATGISWTNYVLVMGGTTNKCVYVNGSLTSVTTNWGPSGGVVVNLLNTNLTTWTLSKLNAFGATDTGASGAGSFSGTARSTDPNSANAASFVQADSTAGDYHRMYESGISMVTGTFSYTVKAKPDGVGWVKLLVGSVDGVSAGYFNVSSGATGVYAETGTHHGIATSIASAGGGWYLCTMTGSISADDAAVAAWIYVCDVGTADYWDGDNTSGLFLFEPILNQ